MPRELVFPKDMTLPLMSDPAFCCCVSWGGATDTGCCKLFALLLPTTEEESDTKLPWEPKVPLLLCINNILLFIPIVPDVLLKLLTVLFDIFEIAMLPSLALIWTVDETGIPDLFTDALFVRGLFADIIEVTLGLGIRCEAGKPVWPCWVGFACKSWDSCWCLWGATLPSTGTVSIVPLNIFCEDKFWEVDDCEDGGRSGWREVSMSSSGSSFSISQTKDFPNVKSVKKKAKTNEEVNTWIL